MYKFDKTILFVISICFLTILFNGCSDDWLEVGGTDHYTIYYKPSSVNIDIQNKTIKVLTKHIYNEKGIIFMQKEFGPFMKDKDYYNNYAYSFRA